jgi:hypothetical protein
MSQLPRPGPLAGGCPCGAVRFEIAAVFDCRYCHCAYCRRTSGAPVSVGAVVRPEDFRMVAGSLADVRGAKGRERRCVSCRSVVGYAFDTSVGPFVSVGVGLLDDPDACPPRFHQFFGERLHWLHVHDTLPKYAGGRIPHPDEREPPVASAGRRV